MRTLRSLLAVLVLASFGGAARADEASEARVRRIDAWIDLAIVGDDADRDAAVEALAREGAPAVARLVERLKALAPPSQTAMPQQADTGPEAQSAADVPVQTVEPPEEQTKADGAPASYVASFTVTGAYIEGHGLLDARALPPGVEEGVPWVQAVAERSAARPFTALAQRGVEVVPFEATAVNGRAVVERERVTSYRRDAVRGPEGWRAAPAEIREGWRLEIGIERTKAGERVLVRTRSARIARPMRTEAVVVEGSPAIEIDVPEWSVVSAETTVDAPDREVVVLLPGLGADGASVVMRLTIRPN